MEELDNIFLKLDLSNNEDFILVSNDYSFDLNQENQF